MASRQAYTSSLIINDISFLPFPPLPPLIVEREDAGLWRYKSLLEEKQKKQLFLLTFLSSEEESSPPRGVGSRSVHIHTIVHSYTHIQTHTHGHKPLSHTPRRGGLAFKQEHTAGCRLPGKAWCVPPSRHTLPSQRLFVGADSSPALWLSAALSTGVCSYRHGGKQGQSHEKERQHPGEGNITSTYSSIHPPPSLFLSFLSLPVSYKHPLPPPSLFITSLLHRLLPFPHWVAGELIAVCVYVSLRVCAC